MPLWLSLPLTDHVGPSDDHKVAAVAGKGIVWDHVALPDGGGQCQNRVLPLADGQRSRHLWFDHVGVGAQLRFGQAAEKVQLRHLCSGRGESVGGRTKRAES